MFNMKKLLILAITLILGAGVSLAQQNTSNESSTNNSTNLSVNNRFVNFNKSKLLRLGGFYNVNMMFMSDKPDDVWSLGCLFEGGASVYVADILYLGAGLGYWGQSYKYERMDVSNNHLYIPIQIGLQYDFNNKIGAFCNTGPQLGWLVSEKIEDEKVDLDGEDTGFTNWTVRFGLRLWGFEAYALYQKGISGFNEDAKFWGVGIGGHF